MMYKRRAVLKSLILTPGLLAWSVSPGYAATEVSLVDPGQPAEDWKSHGDRKNIRWHVSDDGAERSYEIGSAGAVALLTRDVHARIDATPWLEWRWNIESVPLHADLGKPGADDIAAGLALVFGKAGVFRKVPPTLIYSWAGDANREDSIVRCRRHPDAMRFVVVRSGTGNTGMWHSERRNVLVDYTSAFGQPPQAPLHSVVLWSDSDQTNSTSHARFGQARLRSI